MLDVRVRGSNVDLAVSYGTSVGEENTTKNTLPAQAEFALSVLENLGSECTDGRPMLSELLVAVNAKRDQKILSGQTIMLSDLVSRR